MAEYIKRQDAIDPFLVGKNTFAGFCTIEQAIENIESVEAADVVEVRHGEWERFCDDCCECSLCGTVFVPQMSKMPFCPHCGARMDGRGEGE